MRRNAVILAVLAFALVLGMGIAPAWAYFTDSTMASGAIEIETAPPTTHIHESVKDGVKYVSIENDASSKTAVFVRARVFTTLEYTAAGTNWSAADADGWMTYSQAVEPGASTESLDIKITFPDAKQGDNYNVVVVYQSIPAQFDSQGNPTPDWSQVLDEATEKEGM